MGNRFGQYVRDLREAAGMQLTELAAALSCSRGYLCQIEYGHGRTLTPKYWPALVAALPAVSTRRLEELRVIALMHDTLGFHVPDRYVDVFCAVINAAREDDDNAAFNETLDARLHTAALLLKPETDVVVTRYGYAEVRGE